MSSSITRLSRISSTMEDDRIKDVRGWLLLAVGSAMFLSFCACVAPTQLDVAADRATYDAIAADYLRYVNADAALSAEDKARRARTVETWNMRIAAQEQPK